ncbi:MAG: arylformamidase [Gammaproteobacteria bacterium]|jgi:arylformamidase
MSYLDFSTEELIYQYNPRIHVPEHEVWKAHWKLASARVRSERDGLLRVAYGPTAGQNLDIYPAHKPNSPINIFVHGGFWRFLDSFDHTLVVPAVVDAGGASILLNYDLCPSVSLHEVIGQIRTALQWVWNNAEQANGNREEIYISGHSAGGHLAMMLCRDDLEPILLVPGAEELLVTADTVRAVSPRYSPPAPHVPLVVAVGARETSEWIRQTDEMVAVLNEQGNRVTYLKPDYDQHFSILLSLGNPQTELCSAMLKQMKLL